MATSSFASDAAIGRIDDLLGSVGMVHGKRKTRKGLAGPRRSEKSFKEWPAVARRVKRAGLELVQVPDWIAAGKGSAGEDSAGKDSAGRGGELGWLRHAFSTRTGGMSQVYLQEEGADGELNLSWTKEDDPAMVAENRTRFVRAVMGAKPGKKAGTLLATLRQIHSGAVHVLRREDVVSGRLANADGRATLRGDGMMTNVPGLLLGIQTADCIPVLLADRKGKAVAAFHAGWRGTLARIVERGVGRMRLEYGTRPRDILAAIGPGIGPCCYSVGDEVRYEFTSQFAYADELFSEVYDSDPVREKYPMLFLTQRAPGHSNLGPQTHLDLWQANLQQLLDAGVPRRNITVIGECTACNPARYFSHRAQRGFTGRMLNVIGVVG